MTEVLYYFRLLIRILSVVLFIIGCLMDLPYLAGIGIGWIIGDLYSNISISYRKRKS